MGEPGTKEPLTLAEEGPVLVDVRVSPEENCYPMIPAGQAARDMVG